jgi:hypothetical protein
VKRIGLILFLLVPALLLMAPAVSAHDHGGGQGGGHHPTPCTPSGGDHGHGHHGRGHGNGNGHCKNHGGGKGGGGQTAQFAASAGNTMPGGSILLHADVTNVDTTVPLTVHATAHFAALTVTVPLTVVPGTNEYTADGAIGVGGEEPTGTVNVDFTFDYGGVTTTVTVQAQVAWPTT